MMQMNHNPIYRWNESAKTLSFGVDPRRLAKVVLHRCLE